MTYKPIVEDFGAINRGLARVRGEPGKINVHRLAILTSVRICRLPALMATFPNGKPVVQIGMVGRIVGYSKDNPDLAQVELERGGVVWLASEHYEAYR